MQVFKKIKAGHRFQSGLNHPNSSKLISPLTRLLSHLLLEVHQDYIDLVEPSTLQLSVSHSVPNHHAYEATMG